MNLYRIELTRNSAFDYAVYDLDRRILRIRPVGGICQDFLGVPFEVTRAFPTGITGLSFVLRYIRARYSSCATVSPELDDPEFPKQFVTLDGSVVEINPRARKLMAEAEKAKRGKQTKAS
jgi:hypothetical protein